MHDQLKMSWVTLDRFCQEESAKDDSLRRRLEADHRPLRSSASTLADDELLGMLGSMGFELDRRGVEDLCAGALSAEEVARPLHKDWEARNPDGSFQVDWIWICLLALWEPDKICLELLDDKIQAGYERQEQGDRATCAATWLNAWADVLSLCDATGIGSIDEFDGRFPLTQSLYNWLSDVEIELWNAGIGNREFQTARIGFCSEALRRFPGEEQWRAENLRRALAETFFEIGEHDKADELFESWLTADPQWDGAGSAGPTVTAAGSRPIRKILTGPKTCCCAGTRSPGSVTGPTLRTGLCSCARKPAGQTRRASGSGRLGCCGTPRQQRGPAAARSGVTNRVPAAAAGSTGSAAVPRQADSPCSP